MYTELAQADCWLVFLLIKLLDGFCCRLWLTVHSSDLCVRKQCDVIELYCLYDRFWGNPCYTHFLTVKFGKNAGCWYSSDLKAEKEDLRERKNHKQNLIETFLGAIPS